MTTVSACVQKPGESFNGYFTRKLQVFNTHSVKAWQAWHLPVHHAGHPPSPSCNTRTWSWRWCHFLRKPRRNSEQPKEENFTYIGTVHAVHHMDLGGGSDARRTASFTHHHSPPHRGWQQGRTTSSPWGRHFHHDHPQQVDYRQDFSWIWMRRTSFSILDSGDEPEPGSTGTVKPTQRNRSQQISILFDKSSTFLDTHHWAACQPQRLHHSLPCGDPHSGSVGQNHPSPLGPNCYLIIGHK